MSGSEGIENCFPTIYYKKFQTYRKVGTIVQLPFIYISTIYLDLTNIVYTYIQIFMYLYIVLEPGENLGNHDASHFNTSTYIA